MGLNTFSFNGVSSATHGIYVGGQNTYNAPQRDVTKVAIPGRNGDLIKDNGRWLNIEVPYNVVIMDNFQTTTDALKAWLLAPTGYARLEDTYHPDSFRMARYVGGTEFETSAWNKTGKGQIIFDCKPQRWLTSGETEITAVSGNNINNPTNFYSLPWIRITCTGSGTLTIGSYTVTVTGISTYVDIDCDLQDCYADTTNLNDKVTLAHGFPVLMPGNNLVSWTGNITAVKIKGRWFTL